MTVWPGKDYHNGNICDYKDVKNYDECLFDKNSICRMPRRDIAMQIKGEFVLDLMRHFIQYWNFVKYELFENKESSAGENKALYVSSFNYESNINAKENDLAKYSLGVIDENETSLMPDTDIGDYEAELKIQQAGKYWRQKWKMAITKVILGLREKKGGCIAKDVAFAEGLNNLDGKDETINEKHKSLFHKIAAHSSTTDK